MAPKTVSCGVILPAPVVESLDKYVTAGLFPSRSAVMLRACEFYLARYSRKQQSPQNKRNMDLQGELRKLLARAELEVGK